MGLVVQHLGVPPSIRLGSERSGLIVPHPGPAAWGFRAPRPVRNVHVPHPGRLMKNAHLLRCTRPSSLRRTFRVRLVPQVFARLASGHYCSACYQGSVFQHPDGPDRDSGRASTSRPARISAGNPGAFLRYPAGTVKNGHHFVSNYDTRTRVDLCPRSPGRWVTRCRGSRAVCTRTRPGNSPGLPRQAPASPRSSRP